MDKQMNKLLPADDSGLVENIHLDISDPLAGVLAKGRLDAGHLTAVGLELLTGRHHGA